MRRALACLAAVLVLSPACSDDEPTEARPRASDLADVEVTGTPGEEPTFDIPTPFEVEDTTMLVLDEGDGAVIAAGTVVRFDFVFLNGRDGAVVTSSYDREPAELVFEESLMAGVYKGLDGVTAGSRVLVGVAPSDGLGADPTQGVRETDTLLLFAEILDVRVPLDRAEGQAVPPVDGLPTVRLAPDGAPTITVPDVAPPAELVAQALIDGRGDVVESGQTVTVHYVGVLWDERTEFHTSWGQAPERFEIGTGGVIPGWDEGLVGRRVGTQVLLVVPPEKGYGETGRGEDIPPGATLVFVIDILDAS